MQVAHDSPDATLPLDDSWQAGRKESHLAFKANVLAAALNTGQLASAYYLEEAGGDLRAAANLHSARRCSLICFHTMPLRQDKALRKHVSSVAKSTQHAGPSDCMSTRSRPHCLHALRKRCAHCSATTGETDKLQLYCLKAHSQAHGSFMSNCPFGMQRRMRSGRGLRRARACCATTSARSVRSALPTRAPAACRYARSSACVCDGGRCVRPCTT